MKLNRFTFISGFLLLLTASGMGRTPDSLHHYISEIQKEILAGELEPAEQRLRILLKNHSRQPRLRITEALLFLNQGGMENRIRASRLLEQYGYRAGDFPLKYFTEGFLLRLRGHYNAAIRAYRKALKHQPYFTEAMVEIGFCYYKQFQKNINRFSYTEIPVSFRDYAIEDYTEAVRYLQEALRLQPFHRKAMYLLGALYVEAEEWEAVAELFLPAAAVFPANPDFPLFLGMAYHRLGDMEAAENWFNQSLPNMNDDQRAKFKNFRQVYSPAGAPVSSAEFWASRDPLLLTPENERLLEHYCRMALVNLRFGLSGRNIPGWKTDRGEIYLRYGPPRQVVFYEKTMEDLSTIYPPMEIWIYPDFQMVFEDTYWNGEFRFAEPDLNPTSRSAFRSRTAVSYTLFAEDLVREIPERYDFELPGGSFAADYKIYQFRKDGQQTELWLVYEFPVTEFPESSLFFKSGLFLWQDSVMSRLPFAWEFDEGQLLLTRRPEGRLALGSREVQTLPGSYHFSLEFMEMNHQKQFVHRDSIRILDFPDGRLAMSEIVAANLIRTAGEADAFERQNLTILPNIKQVFRQQSNLYLYFELYGLQLNDEGHTYYLVETTLIPDKGNIFSRIFNPRERTTIVNEYQGSQSQEAVVQTISLENISAGNYKIEFRVTDKISLQKTTQHLNIKIIKEAIN